ILSRWKFIIPGDDIKDRPLLLLLIPGLLLCLGYEYWMLITVGSDYSIVLIANFMVIFFATFFYHRFWREQYLLNGIAITGLIAIPFLRSELLVDSILLIIFHLCSVVLAFFFRRQFVGTMYVANLKRSRQELQEAKERAEISDKLKSVFLSTMSHEVRTPLNVILGYTDILQMSFGDNLTDQQREFVDIINQGGSRLIRLMDDILDISRIETGTIILKTDQIIGDELVKTAATEIKMAARQKNLTIREDYRGGAARITVDIVRMQQVLGNLLNNAVKFTPQGEILITTCVTGSEYQVAITDTGIGIKAEFRPHLFTLFKQAEEGYTRSFEGVGLGLAITQRLVVSMNGRIEVESQEGQGSTFTISLPLSPSRQESENKNTQRTTIKKQVVNQAMQEATGSDRLKLLILEDNPANIKYIEFLLTKLKHDFISMDSGIKALARLDEINPDGMLIDISLSEEMDGIEFLRRVRENQQYKNLPAIAVTAHAMKGMQDDFIKQGFTDYLSKPFTIGSLTEVLQRNFQKQ
ncbi:MAG: ATP-binding protein, partial [Candidatus Neomarinimicrobiota bacterium]